MDRLNTIRLILSDKRNVSLAIFLVIGLSITWSTIGQIELNYRLEQEASELQAQIDLLELQNKTQLLENEFLRTDYAQELAARSQLGLVDPGEKVLLLSQSRIDAGVADYEDYLKQVQPTEDSNQSNSDLSNLERWVRFYRGDR